MNPGSIIKSCFTGAKQTLTASVDAVFPPIVRSQLLAAEAQGWAVDQPAAYCHRCGASVGEGEATLRGCSHCVGQPIAWQSMMRLSVYAPPMSQWIIAMKFHKEWPWASWFGAELARVAGPMAMSSKAIVCPVPMPALRRWWRGFSQADVMASAFAKAAKLRMVPLLHRKGWQRPQTHVLASQRDANVRHAFRMDAVDLTGHDIWLIDDVKTTGATLTACARLLRAAGAENVHVAVAAVADPKHADFKLK